MFQDDVSISVVSNPTPDQAFHVLQECCIYRGATVHRYILIFATVFLSIWNMVHVLLVYTFALMLICF
jgi:hypothetical protein